MKKEIKFSLVKFIFVIILIVGIIVGFIIAINKIKNKEKEETNKLVSSFFFLQ